MPGQKYELISATTWMLLRGPPGANRTSKPCLIPPKEER